MDADPYLVETLYLACNRDVAATSVSNIPVKERPTYEELDGYIGRFSAPADVAWSDRYPELCLWLNDYDQKRLEQDSDTFNDDTVLSYRR